MNEVASLALNFTEVAPARFVPLIVMVEPGAAVAGENDERVGLPSPESTKTVAIELVEAAPSLSVATAVML